MRAAHHNLRHGAADDPAWCDAGLQQGDEVGLRLSGGVPRFGGQQRRGVPLCAWHVAPAQGRGAGQSTQSVARRMARRAVAQALHQVSPPVPLSAALRVPLISLRLKVQCAPGPQGHLGSKRPAQLVRSIGLAHGGLRLEIRQQRIRICPGDGVVAGVRKGGVQQAAIFGAPLVHGLPEVVRRPAPQPGLRVRGKVA